MSDFENLIRAISRRPAMFVGGASLRGVSNYLDGYCHALGSLGGTEMPLDGWGRWIESRFLISHPAWHWTRILLYYYEDDRDALNALPSLYDEFLEDRATLGVHGIEAEHTRRFLAKYGREFAEPDPSETSDSA